MRYISTYGVIGGFILTGFLFFFLAKIFRNKKSKSKKTINQDLPIVYELAIIWGTEYQVIGGLGGNLTFDNKKALLRSINEVIAQASTSTLYCDITLMIIQNDTRIITSISGDANSLLIGHKLLNQHHNALIEEEFSERINELINAYNSN